MSDSQEPQIDTCPQPIRDKRKLCEVCIEENLTSNVHIARCATCHETFCVHFASSIDPNSCAFCLHDVAVTQETVTKTQEFYNEETDKLITRTRKAKQIKLGGLHWLFFQRKIRTMSDAELEVAIEYHHAIQAGMILERDQRRVEHFHRNAGKTFKKPTSTDGTTVTTNETVTVKKTRTTKVKSPDAPEINAKSILQSLLASGLTLEQIAKTIAGGKG